MKPVNICILGCGRVARTHSRVGRTLRKLLRFSYASRSLEKAREFNGKYKGSGAFGSYEEACSSSDVDAVFICTPHALHVEHAELAAKSGKPLLIEKPVTRTLKELRSIEQAVTTAHVECMVAENYFFKPLVPVLAHHIQRGDIGEPLFIELNKTGMSRNTGWRTDTEMMGGGALLEGGVHWVNLLRSIGGPALQAVAVQPTVDYPRAAPVEDNLQVLVQFQSGAVGKLLHSWRTANRIGGLSSSRIYGTEGNVIFESNGLWALVVGRRKQFRIPGVLDIMGYRAMLRAFAKCVQDGTKPAMSLAVARKDMELIFAAYRSLRSGRFEPIGTPETQPQIPALMSHRSSPDR